MDRNVYDSMRVLQNEHWWFRGRRRILGRLIASLELKPGSHVLEAGCGSGGNIALLQKFGEVSAFEMDDEARRACLADTGIDCAAGSLPAQNPFQSSHAFDLAVMLDVLEHIDDDQGSLRSLATCLDENGVMLITVPAYQWMYSGHDAIHHHKRRYSRKKLEAVVNAAGCSVLESGYFNSILFPVVALVRIASKAFEPVPGRDMKMPGKIVNAVLFRIFAAEEKLVQFPGFSLAHPFFWWRLLRIVCTGREFGRKNILRPLQIRKRRTRVFGPSIPGWDRRRQAWQEGIAADRLRMSPEPAMIG